MFATDLSERAKPNINPATNTTDGRFSGIVRKVASDFSEAESRDLEGDLVLTSNNV